MIHGLYLKHKRLNVVLRELIDLKIKNIHVLNMIEPNYTTHICSGDTKRGMWTFAPPPSHRRLFTTCPITEGEKIEINSHFSKFLDLKPPEMHFAPSMPPPPPPKKKSLVPPLHICYVHLTCLKTKYKILKN